jgi:hypothetical protein
MRKFLFLLAALAASAGLSLGMVLSTSPAGAATRACVEAVTTHNGATPPTNPTNNWCASQDLTGTNLALSTTNKSGVYSRLTLKIQGQNKQTDFQFFPLTVGNNAKVFEWSPRGVASGLCMDVSNNHAVPVLKHCSDTKLSQRWDAVQIGDTNGFNWVNEATGTALTAPSAVQYVRLTLGNGSGWTYDGSGS